MNSLEKNSFPPSDRRHRVSYEDTFLQHRVGLLSVRVWDAYIRNASENFEVREDWLPSNEDLVWSSLVHCIDGVSIHEIDGHGCRFGPIEVRHVLLTHHGSCYLDYLSILSLGYSVLLGSVSA